MQMNSAYYIDEEILTAYSTFLRGEERSESTIKKYLYNSAPAPPAQARLTGDSRRMARRR